MAHVQSHGCKSKMRTMSVPVFTKLTCPMMKMFGTKVVHLVNLNKNSNVNYLYTFKISINVSITLGSSDGLSCF